MVSCCCVCKLTQGAVENVTFHSIPNNDKRREKWQKSLNRSVSKTSTVCSLHFQEIDFVYKVVGDRIRRFLKPTAFPTLLLGENNNTETRANSTCNAAPERSVDSYFEKPNDMSSNIVPESTDVQNENCCSANFNQVVSETVTVSSLRDSRNQGLPFNDTNTCDGTKRKSNDEFIENESKRLCNPRYVGDLTREYFTTEGAYNIVKKYYETTTKQLKTVNQKLNRVQKRFDNLDNLLKHLKKEGLLSEDIVNNLDVSGYDFQQTMI